jgi:transposase-like protein
MSKKDSSPAAPEGARRASGGAAGDGAADRGRFSSRRKMEAVLRLLRGETLDAVSRELGVAGATLGQWREQFLAAGRSGLKSREPDEHDEEILRLRAKVGEITMSNELLLERARAAEAGRPLAPRRSSP